MPRTGNRKRQTQAEAVARRAAKAAAEAVLEQMADDDEDEEEVEESIQPGDDGRPKTQKGKKAPGAGGPRKDVKLGAEGPDAEKTGSVMEQEEGDEEEDEDEVEEGRNPLGRHLRSETDDNDEDDVGGDEDEDEEEVAEGKADDQLTDTDDDTRIDARKKRSNRQSSGDIGNEISDDGPIPSDRVVEDVMAGEGAKPAAQQNPGSPGDQLTDDDNDTGSDVKKKGQRSARGQGGKPSTGSLGAAQDKKEQPLDPAAVGLDKTVAEATNALFNGEDLTEEFKTKASTILQAALTEIAGRQESALTETYNGYLDEKVAEITERYERRHEQVVAKVDDYLAYVVEEWMKENEVAIESGIKGEINSSFMKGLHELFAQHHIELPDDKVDAYVETRERVSELEDQLNEQINANVELKKRLNVVNISEVFDEVADGLAETQKEKLRTLASGLEYDDAAGFKAKVEILRESYFSVTPRSNSDDVDESNEQPPKVLNEKMQTYANVTSRMARNPSPTGKSRPQDLNG